MTHPKESRDTCSDLVKGYLKKRMCSYFVMSADRAFGFLLFSGVIVLTVSKQTGVFSRLNWISSIYKSKDRNGPNGDFVIGKNSKNSRWKDFVSSRDAEEAELRCEIEVQNDSGEMLVFCWIMPSGKLRNFTPIHDGSIKDNSVSNRHVECTFIYHAFVCMKKSRRSPKTLEEVSDEDFVFVYRPTLADFRHKISMTKSRRNEFKAHITCKKIKIDEGCDRVTDTSSKVYTPHNICGFLCHVEPGVFEQTPGFLGTLTTDLEMLCCLLPVQALKKLQQDTPLWINISIKFGPTGNPVDNSMCFHPSDGQAWLCSMGMRPDKAGGIEMYCASNYLDYRKHWGVGGVLLHEFSHAYHYKHCRGGYNNKEIRLAYDNAMDKKLYDCVPVHGIQGAKGNCKAYACYNCMEFFAELSVAFLWQKDSLHSDVPHTCVTEYNKWYPHNYSQLRSHDVDSCRMLAGAWHVDLKDIPYRGVDNSDAKNVPKNIPYHSIKHVSKEVSVNDQLNPMLEKLRAYAEKTKTRPVQV